jgi:hypothetical protein
MSRRHFSDTRRRAVRRSRTVVGLLLWSFVLTLHTLASGAGELPNQVGQPKDPCQPLIRQSTKHLWEILEARFRRGFPVAAQLEEGYARLSPLSIVIVDCAQQRVVVSGNYEFRGNLGVMDVTRRGTTALQFRMTHKPAERQVWLADPEVLDVTFDNPAPWFDGKAISNWALFLFANPVCANLRNDQPC